MPFSLYQILNAGNVNLLYYCRCAKERLYSEPALANLYLEGGRA